MGQSSCKGKANVLNDCEKDQKKACKPSLKAPPSRTNARFGIPCLPPPGLTSAIQEFKASTSKNNVLNENQEGFGENQERNFKNELTQSSKENPLHLIEIELIKSNIMRTNEVLEEKLIERTGRLSYACFDVLRGGNVHIISFDPFEYYESNYCLRMRSLLAPTMDSLDIDRDRYFFRTNCIYHHLEHINNDLFDVKSLSSFSLNNFRLTFCCSQSTHFRIKGNI